jgi:putative ABC transport system permease protein
MEASRVQPSAAVARPEADRRVLALSPQLALAGLASLGFSGLLVLLPLPSPLPGHFSAFFVLLGFGLMVPLAAVVLARGASPTLGRWFGLPLDLGLRSVTASLSRTAPAMGALLVALAMVVGVTLMVQSFRQSLLDWIGQTIRADVYIVPEGRASRGNEAFLPDGLLERLARDPDVLALDGLRRVDAEVGRIPAHLNAFRFDLNLPGRNTLTPVLEGDSAEANRLCRETDAVLISDVLANLAHLRPGQSLTLPTPRGPRSFNIAGVYRDYSADGGQILMCIDRFRAIWGDPRTNNCALYLRPGADADQVTDRLRAELGREGFHLILRSNASLRQDVVRVFDNTFAITFVMQGLTAAVAFCGILAALLALLLERTRELATLRALGMTRPQLHTMLRGEAASMGILATALGSMAGLVLTILLVTVINVRSFGWTIDLHITGGVFVAAGVIALLASLGATILPARRLDRLSLASALREE